MVLERCSWHHLRLRLEHLTEQIWLLITLKLVLLVSSKHVYRLLISIEHLGSKLIKLLVLHYWNLRIEIKIVIKTLNQLGALVGAELVIRVSNILA